MDYNKLKALLRGGAQGASLGFADEIKGGLNVAGNALSGNIDNIEDTYTKGRDEYRKNDLSAKEASPGMYTAGELGGGLASAVAMPGGALKAPSMMKALAQAAGYGGAYGLGSSDASDAAGLATDTAKGAAMGLVAAPAAQLAGKALGVAAHKALPTITKKGTGAIGNELGEMAAQMKYAPDTDAANRISQAVSKRMRSDSVADNYANEIMQRKAAGVVDDAATMPGTSSNGIDDNTNEILKGLVALKGR